MEMKGVHTTFMDIDGHKRDRYTSIRASVILPKELRLLRKWIEQREAELVAAGFLKDEVTE